MVQYLHRIDNGELPSPTIAKRMLQHLHGSATRDEDTCGLTRVKSTSYDCSASRVAQRRVGITPHTVSGYVKAIYRKLNISSRAEAAIEATRRGLT